RLIRDGAKLIESAEDVLAELRGALGAGLPEAAARATARPAPPGTPADDEQAALLQAMAFDPIDVDELVSRTGQPAGRLGALLLRLELDGKVERLVDGRFARLGG